MKETEESFTGWENPEDETSSETSEKDFDNDIDDVDFCPDLEHEDEMDVESSVENEEEEDLTASSSKNTRRIIPKRGSEKSKAKKATTKAKGKPKRGKSIVELKSNLEKSIKDGSARVIPIPNKSAAEWELMCEISVKGNIMDGYFCKPCFLENYILQR